MTNFLNLEVKVDRTVGMGYIQFTDERVYITRELTPGLKADFDGKGKVVGVEFFDVPENISEAELAQKFSWMSSLCSHLS